MYSGGMIEKELVAASTAPLILSLLTRGESYGYELIQEVKRLSGDEVQWTGVASNGGLRLDQVAMGED